MDLRLCRPLLDFFHLLFLRLVSVFTLSPDRQCRQGLCYHNLITHKPLGEKNKRGVITATPVPEVMCELLPRSVTEHFPPFLTSRHPSVSPEEVPVGGLSSG